MRTDVTGRRAIIVDPYRGATDFVAAFRKRDVEPVAVFSSAEPLPCMGWQPERLDMFAAAHWHDGDFASIAATVHGYDPICVVAGNECGVEFTDQLVQLCTPGMANAPGMAVVQRDKWRQAQALGEAGVPHLRQVCVRTVEEAADWIDGTGLRNQALVFKPTMSSGTDNVYLIQPGEDWRPIFRHILGAVNRMGVTNDSVLIMEFAEGPEYMVDTHSVDGRHGLAMVSVYGKHNRDNHLGIYEMGETLAPDDPQTTELYEYIVRVLDAVGIRNTSAHAEVIVTADGPRLVEVGARFSGSCMQVHQRISTGDCQIDRAVRHGLDGGFTPYYQMIAKARTTWLSANEAGTLRNAEILSAVHDLPTARAMTLPAPGTQVVGTSDVFTLIGWVILASDSQAAIDADYARIRELEAQLRFEPEHETAAD
jgi:hypothetical protein